MSGPISTSHLVFFFPVGIDQLDRILLESQCSGLFPCSRTGKSVLEIPSDASRDMRS